MIEFLLDTNIVSELTKRVPNPTVLRHFRDRVGTYAIGAPTWHELMFGLQRLPDSRRRVEFERYFRQLIQSDVPVLAYDHLCAEWHAAERARLVRIGRTPPYADGEIAAIAAVYGIRLVTANVKDFEGFQGISIENWFR
ncbi:MAG: type II toxin-antitoxin system VapC family toxin [Chloroflexota bacterium]